MNLTLRENIGFCEVYLKHLCVFILLLIYLVGCAPGQSLEDFSQGNTIQSEHKINPLFEAETLSHAYGDGKLFVVTLKVPLTKDSLGTYDFSDIMDNEDLDDSNRSWIKRLFDTLMYNLANISFKFGRKNKYSYTAGLEFPEIDPRYVKEVRIKKLFFSLEDCDPLDEQCVKRYVSKPPSLNFLKSFFLNISPLKQDEEKLMEEGVFKEVHRRKFKRIYSKAFHQKYFNNFADYFNSVLDYRSNYDYDISREEAQALRTSLFEGLNVARLDNSRKYSRREENQRDHGKVFLFRLKKNIDKFKRAEIKRHFRQDIFKSVLADITFLGDNLVVELMDKELRADFFRILSNSIESVDELGINSFEGCSFENCANIDVNSINLVPLLNKSYKLKLDTYLELRFLEINDFLYNGFVEIEVKLDLPL